MGLEAVLVVPHEAVSTTERRARRCPSQVPLADAVYNVAHIATLVLGLASGDWDLIAAGLGDRLHQPHRAHLYPRSAELLERAPTSARSGRRSQGPGRPCSSGVTTSRRACDRRRSRAETRGWATVMRAPFESQGADVREL